MSGQGGYEVVLLRYDISNGMAAQFSAGMLGVHVEAIWHTSLLVYGTEHFFDGGVGIVCHTPPETTHFGRPIRREVLGRTSKTDVEFGMWNEAMRRTKYGPTDYHLLGNNCNNYTNDAALFLFDGEKGIPSDISGQIERLLSTPLGQLMKPSLEMMVNGGNAAQFATPPQPAQVAPQPQQQTRAAAPPAPQTGLATKSCVDEGKLEAALEQLESGDNAGAASRCLRTLKTICQNISDNPGDPRYRRVSSRSKMFNDTVAGVAGGVELLLAVGFVLEDGYYIFKGFLGDMPGVKEATESALEVCEALWASTLEEEPYYWTQPYGTEPPPNALHVGKETAGKLYAARATYPNGTLSCGKFASHLEGCNGVVSGKEAHCDTCEVLCCANNGTNIAWVQWDAAKDAAPEGAVRAFPADASNKEFVARGFHEGNVHPGGYVVGVGCTIPWGGRAARIPIFEVLCTHDGSLGSAKASPALEFPASIPITSIDDLLLWEPRDDEPRSRLPLQSRPASMMPGLQPSRPQLMVCHDFRGGYVDGEHIQSSTLADPNTTVYTVSFWEHVDSFVYFGHHRVSLPPAGWVQAAHQHGVPIYGTFITEWEAGEAECNKMLSSVDATMQAVRQMVRIAEHHKFDGYLVNIENPLSVDAVRSMVYFVQQLTSLMHAHLPHSKVIWYDAVTVEGKLQWQNGLTARNKPFFDACDGIFTNYHWQGHQPEFSAATAAHRRYDVFTGVDAFGRGTFGGGQWKCNRGFEAIHKADTSVALFAPGWTLENAECKTVDEFEEQDAKFWSLLGPFVECRSAAVRALPFSTTFNPGASSTGTAVCGHRYTNVVSWGHVAQQELRPSLPLPVVSASPDCSISSRYSRMNSFHGPQSLCLAGQLGNDSSHVATSLLLGDCPVDAAGIEIAFTVSRSDPACAMTAAIIIAPTSAGGAEKLVLLPFDVGVHLQSQLDGSTNITVIQPSHKSWASSQWATVTFRSTADAPSCTIRSVVLIFGSVRSFLKLPDAMQSTATKCNFECHIGRIQVNSRQQKQPAASPKLTVSNLRWLANDVVEAAVCVAPESSTNIAYFDVALCSKSQPTPMGQYLGRTYGPRFVISRVRLQAGTRTEKHWLRITACMVGTHDLVATITHLQEASQ